MSLEDIAHFTNQLPVPSFLYAYFENPVIQGSRRLGGSRKDLRWFKLDPLILSATSEKGQVNSQGLRQKSVLVFFLVNFSIVRNLRKILYRPPLYLASPPPQKKIPNGINIG